MGLPILELPSLFLKLILTFSHLISIDSICCAIIARFLIFLDFLFNSYIMKIIGSTFEAIAGEAIDNRFQAVIIPAVQFDQQGIYLLYYCMCFDAQSSMCRRDQVCNRKFF